MAVLFHTIDGEARVGRGQRAIGNFMAKGLAEYIIDNSRPLGYKNQEFNPSEDLWIVAHNTICDIGSDVWVMASRVHLQCEIFPYVKAEDREWFAGLIEEGLATKLFSENCGWENVIELARKNTDSELVLSYTVTEGFPCPSLCYDDSLFEFPEGHEWEGDIDEDKFYGWVDSKPREEVWQKAMEEQAGSNWSPESLRYKIGNALGDESPTALEILDANNKAVSSF